MVAKFNAETARAALEGMGGSILFEKASGCSSSSVLRGRRLKRASALESACCCWWAPDRAPSCRARRCCPPATPTAPAASSSPRHALFAFPTRRAAPAARGRAAAPACQPHGAPTNRLRRPAPLPRPLQSQAEAHFPFLELQSGMMLHVTDTEGGQHDFRFRFWLNNQSRWAGLGGGPKA